MHTEQTCIILMQSKAYLLQIASDFQCMEAENLKRDAGFKIIAHIRYKQGHWNRD